MAIAEGIFIVYLTSMGCCFSKKPSCNSKHIPLAVSSPPQPEKVEEEEKVELEPQKAEKEAEPEQQEENRGSNNGDETTDVLPDISAPSMAGFRSSSCSKEEVESILIQCGRLSRNSSCKKYSGSKRSYDFDNAAEAEGCTREESKKVERPREGRRSRSSSHERRRTPSRERDHRSGSRERSSNAGRRISRSPAKRSTSQGTTSISDAKPGKIVSVPASISASSTESGCRKKASASPRSQSPVNMNRNPNLQQQPVLSRNSSRKAEQSPLRRNQLTEIDSNTLILSSGNNKVSITKPSIQIVDKATDETVMASRSCRKSRDLDLDSDSLINTPTLYNTRLLEDIKNFHRKNNHTTPPSVAKACSIVEAIADLSSCNETADRFSKGVDDQSPSGCKESEIITVDESMFRNYVTVKRGNNDADQESSGSNSFIGGAHISIVSPSSADSVEADRYSQSLGKGVRIISREGKSLSSKSRRPSPSTRMTIGRGNQGVSAIVAAAST